MNIWDDEVPETERLMLLTPDEYDSLPPGIVVTAIDGTTQIKGRESLGEANDGDTRFGHLAWGVIVTQQDA